MLKTLITQDPILGKNIIGAIVFFAVLCGIILWIQERNHAKRLQNH